MSLPPSELTGSSFIFDAHDHMPIQDWTFDATHIKPHHHIEWNGVCACGKIEMDGKRCMLGASHKTLAMYKAEEAFGEF